MEVRKKEEGGGQKVGARENGVVMGHSEKEEVRMAKKGVASCLCSLP